jgi:hypothetical protein
MDMRITRLLNLALLSTLVAGAAVSYAQDEKKEEDKPAKQEESKPNPEAAKPAHQNAPTPDMKGGKQDQKPAPEESRETAKPERQENQPVKSDRNAKEMDTHGEKQVQDHPQQAGNARPSGKGGHIPDDKFRTSFGNSHHFNARTVIVRDQRQFQYGGYNFEFVDGWPGDWAYTDDLYVDYIDGEYFLFDLLHPGVRIALFVVM